VSGATSAGEGHPLPESEEARHNEIPEEAEELKGEGEDGRAAVQATRPVEPNGKPYRGGDLGRGPGTYKE
jgi:hypothetical protein